MPEPSSHDRPATYSTTTTSLYVSEVTGVRAHAHPHPDMPGAGWVEVDTGPIRLHLHVWSGEYGRPVADLARALADAARWLDDAAPGATVDLIWPPPAPADEDRGPDPADYADYRATEVDQ